MTAQEEIKNAVGPLVSGTGPQSLRPVGIGMHGPETDEQRIAALEGDIRKLYDGLVLAGILIEQLRSREVGGE